VHARLGALESVRAGPTWSACNPTEKRAVMREINRRRLADWRESTSWSARSPIHPDQPCWSPGATGVGKEGIARRDPRREQPGRDGAPLVAAQLRVECPDPAREASCSAKEEGGAFTGAADRRKLGYFEGAHGGTLFLDEIGEMDRPRCRAKLAARARAAHASNGWAAPDEDRRSTSAVRFCATHRDLEADPRPARYRPDCSYGSGAFNDLSWPALGAIAPPRSSARQHFIRPSAPGADRQRVPMLSPAASAPSSCARRHGLGPGTSASCANRDSRALLVRTRRASDPHRGTLARSIREGRTRSAQIARRPSLTLDGMRNSDRPTWRRATIRRSARGRAAGQARPRLPRQARAFFGAAR